MYCSVALVVQLCPTLWDPMDWSPPGFYVHGILQATITGVSYHSLLQGTFPTKGSQSGLLHCRKILYHLNHQGKPINVVYSHTIIVQYNSQSNKKNWLSFIEHWRIPGAGLNILHIYHGIESSQAIKTTDPTTTFFHIIYLVSGKAHAYIFLNYVRVFPS